MRGGLVFRPTQFSWFIVVNRRLHQDSLGFDPLLLPCLLILTVGESLPCAYLESQRRIGAGRCFFVGSCQPYKASHRRSTI